MIEMAEHADKLLAKAMDLKKHLSTQSALTDDSFAA